MPQRILCIEGDAPSRARVRRALEAAGFAVDEASAGLAGIQRAMTSPPDLVIADVHLPDLEGTEIACRLKQERSLADVPFLALGDADSEHDVALAAGAEAFLTRPVDDERLVAEVRAVLGGRREQLPAEGERAGLKAFSAAMSSHLEHVLGEARTWEERCNERDRLGRIFIGNLAHELRTALTPMAGYLKILSSDKIGPLSAQQRKIVESIQTASGRLTRVVENLSDFATLQASDAALFPSDVDPDALADEVVGDLRPVIREARLHVAVQKSGGGVVPADPRKLKQALLNVVGNAVKFSPHGAEILVEVQRDARAVRFAVYDQGPGIPPQEQKHVFEPLFHAAGKDDRAKHPGSGLGLPVARRILEAHGGTLSLESPPRTQSDSVRRMFTGAKFVLEIPLPRSAG